ncbi:50S ribosomal protein L1 [Phytophthora cinnamomi]|uniref:50S ribosomal protein L1 n=1 Tax=Phytophthora cinnamomi TaxID=4785 RepID=UPI00355A4316|nr:50S ribosomal protein L1 [Phytophthora cinnamomi]
MSSLHSSPEAFPAGNEQRALERFLLDVDFTDCAPQRRQESLSSPPLKKKKLESSWKRRKEELHGLRAQVKEMQTMIAFLKVRNTHSQVLETHGWLSEGHRLWKETAIKERKLCQLAKLENDRVREKTEVYGKMIATLQVVLDAANIDHCEQLVADAVAERVLRSELKVASQLGMLRPLVYSMLENAVQARCGAIESIFSDTRASASRLDTDHAQTVRESAATAMKFKRGHVLPYSTEEVSQGLWDVVKQGIIPDERSARVSVYPDDVVQVEGYFSVPLEHGGIVDLHAHCLMKRVNTSEGFLVLVETSTEWLARLPTSEHWKYQMRGSGWVAVCPGILNELSAGLQYLANFRDDDGI